MMSAVCTSVRLTKTAFLNAQPPLDPPTILLPDTTVDSFLHDLSFLSTKSSTTV
jgi:hypothetical protein